MSLFSYEAIDARGRKQKGEVEADSERGARQLLKSQALIVRSMVPAEQAGRRNRNDNSVSKSHLSGADTVLFLQQLATL
ncbi:MAG: hypothetical protein COX55_07650, partial [Zetaproteobacteria bacterium CG23_combo_of_CG06-09_8_20_14_all_54_7]